MVRLQHIRQTWRTKPTQPRWRAYQFRTTRRSPYLRTTTFHAEEFPARSMSLTWSLFDFVVTATSLVIVLTFEDGEAFDCENGTVVEGLLAAERISSVAKPEMVSLPRTTRLMPELIFAPRDPKTSTGIRDDLRAPTLTPARTGFELSKIMSSDKVRTTVPLSLLNRT